MNRLEALTVDATTCPRPSCDASPGYRCRTRTGRVASYTHSDRLALILPAWRLGYREGTRDGSFYAIEETRRALEETLSATVTLSNRDRGVLDESDRDTFVAQTLARVQRFVTRATS